MEAAYYSGRHGRTPPAANLVDLINCREQSRCQWSLQARLLGFTRLMVSIKCSLCHSLGSASIDCDDLFCWQCDADQFLRILWEVVVDVDDGTGQASVVVEAASIRQLFKRKDAVVDALLAKVEYKCRGAGSLKAGGHLLSESALRLYRMKHETQKASLLKCQSAKDIAAVFVSDIDIFQYLALAVDTTQLFEIMGVVLKYKKKSDDSPCEESDFTTQKVPLQKIDSKFSSDYIELPSVSPYALSFSASSIQPVSRQTSSILGYTLARQLRL